MELDYENTEITRAARLYLESDRGGFDRWINNVNRGRRNRGEETYSSDELWSYFEDTDTVDAGIEQDILLSPDLGIEAGADYLGIDSDDAYMTVIENGKAVTASSRHDDDDVTDMIDSFLYGWKDPREIAQNVETGENGVFNVLNRAGIQAQDSKTDITEQRVRLAQQKGLDSRDAIEEFVFLDSDEALPEKYLPGELQKEKNLERTEAFEVSLDPGEITREEAVAWYTDRFDDDPAQLTTALLKMDYEVGRGEETELIEQASETELSAKKAQMLDEEYGKDRV